MRRPAQSRLPFAGGFTLLEVLVVIIIAGILATSAVIAVGVLGRDRDMQEQAEKLWAILQQAKEECEMQGLDLGLRMGIDSYEFLRFDARQQLWLPIIEDDLLANRQLPDGMRLRLWLEGREAILTEQPGATTESLASDAATKSSGDPEDTAEEAKEKGTDTDAAPKELPPQVVLLSSGDVNLFEVRFERDGSDARWRVFSNPDSSLAAEEMHDVL